jgi:tRNA 2-thiouridine synthesizing protein A
LSAAPPGALLILVADDPLARIDVPHFLAAASHELVEMREAGLSLRFLIRKK